MELENILNEEMNRMKNLFYYERGVVISEQESFWGKIKNWGRKVLGGGEKNDSQFGGFRGGSFEGGGASGEWDNSITKTEPQKKLNPAIVENTETISMDASLFENGISKIDKSSETYLNSVKELKNFISKQPKNLKISVFVQGGASKVGETAGYNNKQLAKERAENYVASLGNSPEFKNVNWIFLEPVISGSDIKNSKEAKKAQFVKLFLISSTLEITVLPEGIFPIITTSSYKIIKGQVQPSNQNITPKKIEIPIPKELKDIQGVKKFQEWLNEKYPTWFKGKTLSSASLGKFGPYTSKAWAKYKNEFLSPVINRSKGNSSINPREIPSIED